MRIGWADFVMLSPNMILSQGCTLHRLNQLLSLWVQFRLTGGVKWVKTILMYLDACRILLENVLNYTSTIANNYPGESGFRSPFVPFGTYMFCSSHGAACIEDSEAVLKMLHLTIRSPEAIPDDQIAHVCISEHTDYGSTLEIITKELLIASQIANFVANSSFEVGIALELEAMGLKAQVLSLLIPIFCFYNSCMIHNLQNIDIILQFREN